MSGLMDAALAYAAARIPVFPCKSDGSKAPLTVHGFKDASTDAEQIKAWWTKFSDAWIGMPTGKASGYDVLDLDKKNGKDGFEQVPGWRDLSPVMAETPSGSMHLYFKADGVSCSADKIASGVDTRGEGGYVIPPSPGYRWLKGGII